ncbi:hypothetical protein JTB14_000482 [Gonioctena quinquepunctata]|nr:hypothetical protein JTB14_000482 [Gonioctena quinquepunctata]
MDEILSDEKTNLVRASTEEYDPDSWHSSCSYSSEDAPKQNPGVGCAYFIHVQNQFKLKPLTSIFSAEAIAIIEAIKNLEDQDINKIVIILTHFPSWRKSQTQITSHVTVSTHLSETRVASFQENNSDINLIWIEA